MGWRGKPCKGTKHALRGNMETSVCSLKDRNHRPLSSLLFMQTNPTGSSWTNRPQRITGRHCRHLSPSPRSQPRQGSHLSALELETGVWTRGKAGQNHRSQSPPATQSDGGGLGAPAISDRAPSPQLCAAQPQDGTEDRLVSRSTTPACTH